MAKVTSKKIGQQRKRKELVKSGQFYRFMRQLPGYPLDTSCVIATEVRLSFPILLPHTN